MKELKIEVPKGYEIDKEKSTFENIVFKKIDPLPKTWKGLKTVSGWYVDIECTAYPIEAECTRVYRNIFPTKEEAEASIALAQLCQLRDRWNEGWKPDWSDESEKYTIRIFKGEAELYEAYKQSRILAFKTEELAKEFLSTFKDLIEQAKPLL